MRLTGMKTLKMINADSNMLFPFENRKVLIRTGQLSGREEFEQKQSDDTTPPPQMPITIHLQPITCDPKPSDTVR